MRITGHGEAWRIECNAEELAIVLVSLKKNTDLGLEEMILELEKRIDEAVQ